MESSSESWDDESSEESLPSNLSSEQSSEGSDGSEGSEESDQSDLSSDESEDSEPSSDLSDISSDWSSESSSSSFVDIEITLEAPTYFCGDIIEGTVTVNADHPVSVVVTPEVTIVEHHANGGFDFKYYTKEGDCGTELWFYASETSGETLDAFPMVKAASPGARQSRRSAKTKANVMKVVFPPERVITGFRIVNPDSNPTIDPISVPLLAILTPKAGAGDVQFESTKPTEAEYEELGRHIEGDSVVVEMQIKGKAMTPIDAPQGDARIVSRIGVNNGPFVPVLVVIPKKHVHELGGPPWYVNQSEPSPTITGAQRIRLKTDVGTLVIIQVLDQFGNLLNAIYDGERVVEEKFSDKYLSPDAIGQEVPGSGAWVPIELPNDHFNGGIKLDDVGWKWSTTVPGSLTNMQQVLWKNGLLDLTGEPPSGGTGNNVFAIRGINPVMRATMSLRVQGHLLDNTYRRMWFSWAESLLPVPLLVDDYPIPSE